MKNILLLFISILFFQNLIAQEPPAGTQDGEAFKDWLKTAYYDGKHASIGYDNARRKIYGYIENFDDTIECVYSGYKEFNSKGNEGTSIGSFNMEHIVPQSTFEQKEPMRSDIHILYPSYDLWNSLRGNYRYTEIIDAQTSQWILDDNSITSIPTTNIEAYSEYRSGISWEPREDKKGDVARAIFYFYTMYSDYGIDDVGLPEIFCDWHKNDLPDDREIQRNQRVPTYQGNINPFISRPEWANNAWGCSLPTSTNLNLISELVSIYPNPASEVISIEIKEWKEYPLKASIISLDGRTTFKVNIQQRQTLIDVSGLPAANYVLMLKNQDDQIVGNKRLSKQ